MLNKLQIIDRSLIKLKATISKAPAEIAWI